MLGAFDVEDNNIFGCDMQTEGIPCGCALAAVVCFVPRLRTNPLLVVASLLAIVGIFCKRVQLLVGGFQIPNLDLSTVMTSSTVTHWEAGMAGAYLGMVYWPAPIE